LKAFFAMTATIIRATTSIAGVMYFLSLDTSNVDAGGVVTFSVESSL
jgi:hypothetical protein